MLIRVCSPQICAKIPDSVDGVVLTHLMPGNYQDRSGQIRAVEQIISCCQQLPEATKKYLTINYSPAFNKKNNRWRSTEDLINEADRLFRTIHRLGLLSRFKIDGVCLVGEFFRAGSPIFRSDRLIPLFVKAVNLFKCPIGFTEYNVNEIRENVWLISKHIAESMPPNSLSFVGQLYSDKPSPRKFEEAASLASLSYWGLPILFVEAAVFLPFKIPFLPYAVVVQRQIVKAMRDNFGDTKLLCWWNPFPDEMWIPQSYYKGGGSAIPLLTEKGDKTNLGESSGL